MKRETAYICNERFENQKFSETPLSYTDFEGCTFTNCDFSNLDVSGLKFVDCAFEGCNLSMIKTYDTVFAQVRFTNCKMLGLRFEDCHPVGASYEFDHCQLDFASFYQQSLKGKIIRGCRFKETDFTECDASRTCFDDCDFLMARFDHTNLEGCDFRTSFQYAISPTSNRINKAKFSLNGVAGLLDEFGILIE